MEMKYEVVRHFPSGDDSVVMLAKVNEREVVVKTLRTARGARFIEHEIAALARLRGIQGVVPITAEWSEFGLGYLMYEYYPGGDLLDYLSKEDAPLLDNRVVARSILEILAAVHDRGYAHMDIKPDNFLLDAELRPHLTDFGFATTDKSSTVRAGSHPFIAPEIVCGLEYEPAKADMWSFALTMYVLVFFLVPRDEPLLLRALRTQYFDYAWPKSEELMNRVIDEETRSFLETALRPELTRLTARELLLHPWLN